MDALIETILGFNNPYNSFAIQNFIIDIMYNSPLDGTYYVLSNPEKYMELLTNSNFLSVMYQFGIVINVTIMHKEDNVDISAILYEKEIPSLSIY